MERFKAKLEPVALGGHCVVVPAKAATAVGLKYGVRVRGTLNGVAYRSSLMTKDGVFHLGVHKATIAKAGARAGDRVDVTIELDDEPLPTDVVPADLAAALAKMKTLRDAWDALPPSHKREHVKAILDAKKPETRARRIDKAVEMLAAAKLPKGRLPPAR